jgi:hypothetical protein
VILTHKNRQGQAVGECNESLSASEYLELILFLGENHNPRGVSYKFALIPDGFRDTGWSLDKIHRMVMEAKRNDFVTIFTTSKHGNWGQWETRPQDLCSVSLTRKGLKLFNSF